MEKLRKVIQQLNPKDFAQIKSTLEKNNSEKFLRVLVSYNESGMTDESIRKGINCSEGAYYVLKSRLLNKIQELLLGSDEAKKDNFFEENTNLVQYLYEVPRETAVVTLHQLEKIYINNDTPQELINVYSALKKIYYHSDKYYYYSQLYNKHIAYTVALEKAEDVLLNFNRTLSNYFYSKAKNDIELLIVLKKEIKNIYSLNQSHRFELIKNFVLIQSQLFTNIAHTDEEDIEEMLSRCEQIVGNYPEDKQIKYYETVINYFWLEYYFKTNQFKKAFPYYDVINNDRKTWLLLSNYCMAFKFLLTKPQLLYKLNKVGEYKEESLYFDNYDFYTHITLKFCKAITLVHHKKLTEAIDVLNELVRDISLHHFFYLEIEIKLTLAYLYIVQDKYEKADRILKSLARKIGDDKKENYPNALMFIKLLNLLMNKTITAPTKAKIQNIMEQFNSYNTTERKILAFLQPEVELYLKTNLAAPVKQS